MHTRPIPLPIRQRYQNLIPPGRGLVVNFGKKCGEKKFHRVFLTSFCGECGEPFTAFLTKIYPKTSTRATTPLPIHPPPPPYQYTKMPLPTSAPNCIPIFIKPFYGVFHVNSGIFLKIVKEKH